jgi:hypothetical protein
MRSTFSVAKLVKKVKKGEEEEIKKVFCVSREQKTPQQKT